jgi:multidrug efflux pump subunit AcrA (membrane-fusion protein)
MTRKVLLTIIVLIVATGIGLYAYLPDLQSNSSEKPPPATVEVIRSSLQTRVSETGTIQPSNTIEIKSQFSGEVARLFVSNGQTVKKGELLAIIRQESSQARQVAQLREAIQEERLNVKTTQREWVRSQSLFKKGFIAQQELETSEDNYQSRRLGAEHSAGRISGSLAHGRHRPGNSRECRRDYYFRNGDVRIVPTWGKYIFPHTLTTCSIPSRSPCELSRLRFLGPWPDCAR